MIGYDLIPLAEKDRLHDQRFGSAYECKKGVVVYTRSKPRGSSAAAKLGHRSLRCLSPESIRILTALVKRTTKKQCKTRCGPWTAVRNVNTVFRGTPECHSVSFKISPLVAVRVLFRPVEIEARHSTSSSCGGAGYEEERVAKIDSQAFPLLYYHHFSFLACPSINLSLSNLFSFSHLRIAPSAPTIGLP